MEDWLSRQLRAASGGFSYPPSVNLKHAFTGRWGLRDGFEPSSAYPSVGENMTVIYELASGLPPRGTHGLPKSGGAIALDLASSPLYSVDSIQAVAGEMALYGHSSEASSSSSSGSEGGGDGAVQALGEGDSYNQGDGLQLRMAVRGHYFADAGLLLMLASKAVGTAKVIPVFPLFPSPSPAPTVSPSPGSEPSPTATGSPQPTPTASASALPSIGGGGQPSAAPQANGQCVYAIAMRFRPSGYDGRWTPGGGTAGTSGSSSGDDTQGAAAAVPIGPSNSDSGTSSKRVRLMRQLAQLRRGLASQVYNRSNRNGAAGGSSRRLMNSAGGAHSNLMTSPMLLSAAAEAMKPEHSHDSLGGDFSGYDSFSGDGAGVAASSYAYHGEGAEEAVTSEAGYDAAMMSALLEEGGHTVLPLGASEGFTSAAAMAAHKLGRQSSRRDQRSLFARSVSRAAHRLLASAYGLGEGASSSYGRRQPSSRIVVDPASLVVAAPHGSSGGRSLAAPAASGRGNGYYGLPTTSPAPYPGARYIPAYGVAVSWNCNVTLNVSATAAVYDEFSLEGKALGYSLMATTTGVILTGATLYQLLRYGSQSSAVRVSLMTVGAQAVLDAYATLSHATAGMASIDLFSSFATTAFIYLTLFAVLEMRLMLTVWKAHRPELFSSGWEAVRRAVFALYCRFYGVMLGGVAVMYIGTWGTMRALILLAYSYWVPQIAHSVAQDCRPGLSRRYTLLVSATRLAIPLYFLACPSNIAYFMVAPESRGDALAWAAGRAGAPHSLDASYADPSWRTAPWMPTAETHPAFNAHEAAAAYWSNLRFAVTLALWTGVQVVVVLLQGTPGWGPRFFVPHVFLPARYDYHRRISVRGGRIVPNPLATHHWMRNVSSARRPAATAAGAGGEAAVAAVAIGGGAEGGAPAAAAGPEPLGQRLRRVGAEYRELALEHVRSANATGVWFLAGCRILASEYYSRARQLVFKGSSSGGGSGLDSRRGSEDSIVTGVSDGSGPSRSDSGAGTGGRPLVHGSAAAAGASSSSRWMPSFVANRYNRLRVVGRDGDVVTSADGGAGLPAEGSGDVSVPAPGDLDAALSEVERGRGDEVVGGHSAASSPSASASAAAGADGEGVSEEAGAIDCAICMDAIAFPIQRRAYMVGGSN